VGVGGECSGTVGSSVAVTVSIVTYLY